MRVFYFLVVPVVCILLAGGPVTEPKTGAEFPESVRMEGHTLCCTGTGYRSFLLFRVFAMAHYGDPEAMPEDETTPEQRLKHWRESKAPHALVLRMMRNVGADRFMGGQVDAMDRAGYHGKNREAYISAFNRGAKKGDEIKVSTPGDGWLVLVWAGEEVGRWQDEALTAAVWSVWLAEESECSNPEALVERNEGCSAAEED